MTVRQIGETAVNSPLKRIALLILAIVFFVYGTAFAVPPVMYEVTIYDGNNVESVLTANTDPYEILERYEYVIDEANGDKLNLKGFDGTNGSKIFILRGVEVTVVSSNGTQKTVNTTGTVGNAISEAGFEVPENAKVSHSLDTILAEGMTIEIYPVYNAIIRVNGGELGVIVSGKTIGDALEYLGVIMGQDDFTTPEESTALYEGIEITVNRVTYSQRTESERVKYETEYTYSDALGKDRQKVIEKGQYGENQVVYSDKDVNGKLQESTVVSTSVVKEPVKELVQVGTKAGSGVTSIPVGKAISELSVPSYVKIGANGLPANYKSIINAKATAYCIPGGITSTGKRAQPGYIAVDPKEIPYGTEMYIVSADGLYVYGYCIAADTGGYIYDVDWTVDLFMNSTQQCINWGRRDVIIYVL